jgi:GeoRSP system SPASM domain protein
MIGELEAPVRVYWDLDGGTDLASALRVAREMIDSGILAASLWERAPAARPAVLAVTERLASAGRAVALTVGVDSADDTLVPALRSTGLRELLVHADTPAEAERAICRAVDLREAARTVGVSVAVTAATVRALPRLLDDCAAHGISRFELPVHRAAGGGTGEHLGSAERRAVARELRAVDYAKVVVVAHDPFLSEMLFPTAAPAEEGCQAAASLVSVSERLQVLACPILPVVLGDLEHTAFGDIVRGAAARETRARVKALPAVCGACPRVRWCIGGCRGRAQVAYGSLEALDPACEYAPVRVPA